MTITGGTVRFLKRIQIAEYQPEEVEVTISFENDYQEQAEAAAIAGVHRILSRNLKETTSLTPASGEVKRGPGRPPKKEEPKPATVELPGEVEETKVEAKDDPLDLGDTTDGTKTVSAPDADLDFLEEGEATVEDKPVTDEDLKVALQTRNSALRTAGTPKSVELKQLVIEFSTTGVMSGIPADKRKEFLTRVAAIK